MKRSLSFLLGLFGQRRSRWDREMMRLRRLAYEDELTEVGNLRAFRE
ncbi:hypothetical protein SAMN04488126_102272 [Bhargavaea beijingensis]|uniref:Uncharacterized protein n=1 Tax=Bhargavaea beijingensis TaxID=426756 RepID=A0A1G6ZC82_9BACL|nr:hypothetical protein [Bhargavaea beijingensis]SDD99913.1 hypothetical protein SAMN04488126_102272 [Bhargavaea beijingensis]